MVECITNVVLATTKTTIQTTNYIFVSCDEVTSIDNQSWIFVHGYVVEDFNRFPILLNMEQVKDGCTTNNLMKMIQSSIQVLGGLSY
jgi:hypothetical protein